MQNLKPIRFASTFISHTQEKYAINELELLAVVWGLEHFRQYIYGEPFERLPDHPALETLIKRYRLNETYRARWKRWLDRLVYFNNEIKHIAEKHLALTDYLRRKPMSSQARTIFQNYDEAHVINFLMLLLEFINAYGSVAGQKNRSANGTE